MAESKDDVKLLAISPSPFCARVQFALELSGISYEVITQDLANKSQLLLDSNPIHKKVPVLLHNGKPICESAIIIEYVDAVWRTGGLSQDPYARAQTRFWVDFIENKLNKAVAPLLRSAKAVTEVNKQFLECCILMEDHLLSKLDESKPFVGGDEPNDVDIMLVPHPAWTPALLALGLELPSEDRCPRFYRLLEALRQHPAAARVLPDPKIVEAKYRKLFASR